MGMDVYGNNDNYFRANIWSWRAICYAIHLAEYEVPNSWHTNDGCGLDNQSDCDVLANKIDAFLASWDGEVLILETDGLRVNNQGAFVDPGTPGSQSPYQVGREHLMEFVAFLRSCDGFQIY